MNQQVVNFSAGPAMLPPSVVQEIQQELNDWYHGMSILEISHRSKPVLELKDEMLNLLKTLLLVPDDFTILTMHGGARGQFAAVPLNLLGEKKSAAYLVTGYWGDKAAKACEQYAKVEKLSLDYAQGTHAIETLKVPEHAAFVHATDNETIEGIELPAPLNQPMPVVCDMTSNILSKAIDWNHFDCVYASAQKNLGVAGCTFVIIKKALLNHAMASTPDVLNYTVTDETNCLYNTPSVFSWYVSHKVLKWVASQGGIEQMQALATARSQKLYDFIDNSKCYTNTIEPTFRSKMNVPFLISNNEEGFFEEAKKENLYFLQGHRSVGGARASMYNAMPVEHVDRLIEFMKAFELRN